MGTCTALARLAPDANVVNEVPGQAGLFDLIHSLDQAMGDFRNGTYSVNAAVAPQAFIVGLNRSRFLSIDTEPVGNDLGIGIVCSSARFAPICSYDPYR